MPFVLFFVFKNSSVKNKNRLLEYKDKLFSGEDANIEEVSGLASGIITNYQIHLKKNQRSIYIKNINGSKNNPASSIIQINLPLNFNFTISKESGLEKFGKKISLLKEVQIGISHLDDYFFISISDDTNGRNMLSNSKVISALEQLKSLNSFRELRGHVDKNSSSISLTLNQTLENKTKEEIDQAINALELFHDVF
jgi:hypothetical protein